MSRLTTAAIRPPLPGETPALAALAARTFRDTFGPDNDPADLERYITESFSLPRIEAELGKPDSTFLVAADGERLVGYAHLHAGAAPSCVAGTTSLAPTRPLELVRLYVDQARIGHGCGAALMEACLQIALEGRHDVLWLGVWEHNPRAVAFYRRWNFETVGDHQFVIGDDLQRDEIMQLAFETSPAGAGD